MRRRRRAGCISRSVPGWMILPLLAMPVQAVAAERCDGDHPAFSGHIVTLRIDNDLFGGYEQDQGYTNGLQISVISPDIADHRGDPCLSPSARWINRYLDWLRPGDDGQRNSVLTLNHVLFTPTDRAASELIVDDRPYAAVLLVGMGYNARDGDSLHVSHIRIGVVGPAALGREAQDAVHKLTGSASFNGWDNQLRNEPVLQLAHERMRRHAFAWPAGASSFGQDAILHWGGILGNLGIHANAGVEWRLGWRLPDDFGSAPLRPAGDNAAPLRDRSAERGWSGHFFVNGDARWVFRNLTLDGNTFKSSHRVDKKPVVADAGYGIVVSYYKWKFAFARYLRTREFYGQRERPVYGSFTISRRF